MEQNPLQDKSADDLCNPIVIVVIFCHIIAIFLNPRKCIAHHGTYMGSLLVVWGGIASAVLLILIFTVSYWVGRRIAKAP